MSEQIMLTAVLVQLKSMMPEFLGVLVDGSQSHDKQNQISVGCKPCIFNVH
jgi:hypothetical protein